MTVLKDLVAPCGRHTITISSDMSLHTRCYISDEKGTVYLIGQEDPLRELGEELPPKNSS